MTNEDKTWFQALLKEKMGVFGVESTEVLSSDGVLLYGDYMNPNADPRIYEEITDHAKVEMATNTFLCTYIHTLYIHCTSNGAKFDFSNILMTYT